MIKKIIISIFIGLMSFSAMAFECPGYEVSAENFGGAGSATSTGDSQAYRCAMRAVWDYIYKSQGNTQDFQVTYLNVNLSHHWNQWYNMAQVSNSTDIVNMSDISDVRFSINGKAIENGIEVPFYGSAYINYERVNANRNGDYAYTKCYIKDAPVCDEHHKKINIMEKSDNDYIIEDGIFKGVN